MRILLAPSEKIEFQHLNNVPEQFQVCVETKDFVMDSECYENGFTINENFLTRKEFPNVKISTPLALKFEKEIEIHADTIFMAFDGAYNYSHWLFNILPRFSYIRNFIKSDYYFILTDPLNDLQKEVYSHLGYDLSKFLELRNGMSVSAKTLWATPRITSPDSNRSFPKWSLDFLNNIYPKEIKDTPKKIYISRRDSPRRNIFNEDELIPIIKEKGFEIVVMSDFKTLQDQINLFYNADYVFSCHGAGLANLIFCKPNTKVLEVFNPNYLNPMYYVLSRLYHLNYSWIFGEDLNNGVNSQFSDVLLNKELLISSL